MEAIMLEVQNILNCELRSIKAEKVQIIQKKRLPVELVYYEEYSRIDFAFYREKQIQGWRREKKEALINGEYDLILCN